MMILSPLFTIIFGTTTGVSRVTSGGGGKGLFWDLEIIFQLNQWQGRYDRYVDSKPYVPQKKSGNFEHYF